MSWKKNRTSFIEIDVIDEKWNVSRLFAGMTFAFSDIFLSLLLHIQFLKSFLKLCTHTKVYSNLFFQGYRSGYVYKQPLVKEEPPKPKSDVELPAAVSSLGYLLEEENLYKDG